jgi:hypothetical protein
MGMMPQPSSTMETEEDVPGGRSVRCDEDTERGMVGAGWGGGLKKGKELPAEPSVGMTLLMLLHLNVLPEKTVNVPVAGPPVGLARGRRAPMAVLARASAMVKNFYCIHC